MISESLKKAREFETEKKHAIPDENRPLFHLTPQAGWLNDPNGFSYYKGFYHLFYQYYPYDTSWGPMHWGHAISKDLLSWEYLPASLAPDQPYDIEGCWSGSAIEMEDGRQMLLYTGRQPFSGDGKEEIRQVQCLALGDGCNYEKWENNPVIDSANLPEGASIYDFRDPKIWKDEKSGHYQMVAASRAADGHGQALLYESPDGYTWNYLSVLDASHGQIGSMWECPDFFDLEGSAVLVLSPQAMKKEGEFQNYHGNAYIIGDYDPESHVFSRRAVHALDFGYDYYAATTLKAPDGRRILVAWMQAWENVEDREFPLGWAGMMTIPRELSVRDGHLIQNPVREIIGRRRNPVIRKNLFLDGEIEIEGIEGRCLDMTVELFPAESGDYESFEICFAKGEIQGEACGVVLAFNKEQETITLDRSASGYADDQLGIRILKLAGDESSSKEGACRTGSETEGWADRKGSDKKATSDRMKESGKAIGPDIRIRILLDRFSAEIFINDGRYSLSSVIDTPASASAISFKAVGQALFHVEKYEIV